MSESFQSWKPYSKIPYKLEKSIKKTRWVVTEKIHGANFSVLYDGNNFQFAKRSKLLSDDEPFFQYQRISDNLKTSVAMLHSKLKRPFKFVALYGELFGGSYPHNSVEPILGLNPIQTGIWYSQNINYMVFDIALYLENGNTSWIPYDFMKELCDQSNLLVVQPLFIGTQQEAWSFPLRFQSTIPEIFGLPPIDSNLAEGIVIRPILDQHVRIKIKNKEFAEINDEISFSASNNDIGFFLSRININRINSARSKLGDIDNKQVLFQAVHEDIMMELYVDNLTLATRASYFSNEQLEAIQQHTLTIVEAMK